MTPPTRARSPLRGQVAVLSPHLDDAVFSVGAAIAQGVREGAAVSVVTVFAGDPQSTRPASAWDRRLGFRLAGEATRARREEDRRACAMLGASSVWLPFDDEHGEPADPEGLRSAIEKAIGRADLVLVPGFPLEHADHLRLAQIVLAKPLGATRIGLYVEQPYAAVRRMPPKVPMTAASLIAKEPEWSALEASRTARVRKVRAWRAYRSQFRHFGYRSLVNVMRYEARHGGELTTFL